MDGQPATEATGPMWFLIVVGSSLLLPVVVMMWRNRRMFLRKKEAKMPDPETTGVDLGEAQPLPAAPRKNLVDHTYGGAYVETPFDTGLGKSEPDTEVREVPMASTPYARNFSAFAPVPAPIVQASRVECEHCKGRGFVPGINDLLQESIALLGDGGDDVIRSFYVELFRRDPDLAALFPGNPTQGDFGTDHKGAVQRDKLLKALGALAQLYDPGDPDKMEHLDNALATYGRTHASFVRKDGTIKGATWEEYAAVKESLFTTLIRVAAEHWRPEYSAAWSQAYDYAAGVMLVEQFRSGFVAPRFPRV